MALKQKAPEGPMCPRCGYDQTGVVDSWKDACPLGGVCSECGLEFAWRDLLNPRLPMLRWSFEHARRLSPARWAKTHARALNPFSFWRSLRLEYPVQPRRLLMSIAAILLAIHLCIAATTVWKAYSAAAVEMTRVIPRFTMGPNGPVVTVPPAPPRPTVGQVLKQFGESLAELAIWPYGQNSVMAASPPRGALWAAIWFKPELGPWLLALAPFVMTAPLGFPALGETFRRCRVRFVHLLRGAAYSLAGPLVAVAIGAILTAAAGPRFSVGLVVAAIVWLCVYWPLYVSRYLRLTHAPWVALAILTIAGLVASITMTLGWMSIMRGVL